MAPGFGEVEAFLGRVWGFSGQDRGEKGNSLWVFLPAGKAAGAQREWIRQPRAAAGRDFQPFRAEKVKNPPRVKKRSKSAPF